MWELYTVLVQAYTVDLTQIVDTNVCWQVRLSKILFHGCIMLQVGGVAGLVKKIEPQSPNGDFKYQVGCTDFLMTLPPGVGPPTRDNTVELLEIDGAKSAYTSNKTLNRTFSATGQNLSGIVIHAQNVTFGGTLSKYLQSHRLSP